MTQKQSTERVGKGTPGKRVKAAWRASGNGGLSLLAWARQHLVLGGSDRMRGDVTEWLASKRPGGTDERRTQRRLRIRERRAANEAARLARRSNRPGGKQQQRKGRGGDDPR